MSKNVHFKWLNCKMCLCLFSFGMKTHCYTQGQMDVYLLCCATDMCNMCAVPARLPEELYHLVPRSSRCSTLPLHPAQNSAVPHGSTPAPATCEPLLRILYGNLIVQCPSHQAIYYFTSFLTQRGTCLIF